MNQSRPLRVLVCGSRDWTDRDMISQTLWHVHHPMGGIALIIHGGCRGADSLAGDVADANGIPYQVFPANWKDGKAAGPIRNTKMLQEGKPDLVLAFTYDLSTSRGTADMVRKARAAGIKTFVLPQDREALVNG